MSGWRRCGAQRCVFMRAIADRGRGTLPGCQRTHQRVPLGCWWAGLHRSRWAIMPRCTAGCRMNPETNSRAEIESAGRTVRGFDDGCDGGAWCAGCAHRSSRNGASTGEPTDARFTRCARVEGPVGSPGHSAEWVPSRYRYLTARLTPARDGCKGKPGYILARFAREHAQPHWQAAAAVLLIVLQIHHSYPEPGVAGGPFRFGQQPSLLTRPTAMRSPLVRNAAHLVRYFRGTRARAAPPKTTPPRNRNVCHGNRSQIVCSGQRAAQGRETRTWRAPVS
jgi:hypothetical protein